MLVAVELQLVILQLRRDLFLTWLPLRAAAARVLGHARPLRCRNARRGRSRILPQPQPISKTVARLDSSLAAMLSARLMPGRRKKAQEYCMLSSRNSSNRRLFELFLDESMQFLRLLPAARHEPGGRANREDAAHRRQAAAGAGRARARYRLRLGRIGDPPRGARRRSGRHHRVERTARAGDAARNGAGVQLVTIKLPDYRLQTDS